MMSFFEKCRHIEYFFRFMVSFSESDTTYKISTFITGEFIIIYTNLKHKVKCLLFLHITNV